jgi:excisionase family DNA binding protein
MTESHSDAPSISPRQFADRFGLHIETVYRYIREGRIAAVSIGPRFLRIRPSEVARFESEPQRETQYVHIDEKPGTAWAKKESMR